MNKINNHVFGLAMYLACDYAQNLEDKKQYDDQGPYEALLQLPDELIIADHAPHLYEEQKEANEEILQLLHFCEDMEDAQTNLFFPEEFLAICKTLFDLVRKGEFKCICAIQETLWSYYEDHDIEVGSIIDPEFLLTFHQRMIEAKNPKVWRYGHFMAAADFVY